MAEEKDAVVWVKATKKGTTGVEFTHESKHLKSDKLTFESPLYETYKMVFILEDESTYDLKFMPNKTAFWSKKGACPTEPTYEGFDENQIRTSHQGAVLTVINTNTDKAEYKYRLRFERRGQTQPEEWDPIIDNKNGPVMHHLIALAVALIVGVAAAISALLMALDSAGPMP